MIGVSKGKETGSGWVTANVKSMWGVQQPECLWQREGVEGVMEGEVSKVGSRKAKGVQ